MERLYRIPRWSLILSFLIAGIFLFFAFRGVSWGKVFQILRQGRTDILILAFFLQSVSYFLRGLRWRVLLSAEKAISPISVFWAMMVGYLGNSFLPARAGDFVRTVVISRNANISKSYALATLLTERVVDVLALVLIGLVMLLGMEGVPEWLNRTTWIMAVLGSASMMALFVAPYMEPWFKRKLTELSLPNPWDVRAAGILERFLLGMRVFHHSGRVLHFIGLTAVIWLADGWVAIEVAHALNARLTLAGALLLLAALGLASAIPSTPGYIGIFQFVAVTVLVPLSFSRSEALAYIIALQGVIYAVVVVWGPIGLWRLNLQTPSGHQPKGGPQEDG